VQRVHVGPAEEVREGTEDAPGAQVAARVGDTHGHVLHDAGVAEAVDHAERVQPSRTYCASSHSNTEPGGSCQWWHRQILSSQSR
jgi:hypothetical protein